VNQAVRLRLPIESVPREEEMSNDLSEIIGIVAIVVLLGSILADTILGATWNRFYFTTGLPILVLRVSVDNHHTNIPASSLLETQFRSDWYASLAFKEISPNSFGFRERLFQFRLMRYSALMHGLLVFDYDKGQVVVKGFLNWFVLCFSLIWLSPVIMVRVPLISFAFIAFFILVLGILYLIQFSRFTKVCAFAARAWSRKYLGESIET
jgi:hypothetical protein